MKLRHVPALCVLLSAACGGADSSASADASGTGGDAGSTSTGPASTGHHADDTDTSPDSTGGETTLGGTRGKASTTADASSSSTSGGETGEPAICGDGIVEGLEVCDGQAQCGSDCTYPPNTIFWEVIEAGVNADDEARVWGVDFDAADRPVYAGRRFGVGGSAFATMREPNGDLVWTALVDDVSQPKFAYGVVVTAQDHIVLPGQISTFTADGNDAYASSFALDGTPGWAWQQPEPANDWRVAGAAYPDGSVALVGAVNSSLTDEDQAQLTRHDPAGAVMWQVDHAGAPGASNLFQDVGVDDEGNAVVLGCCDDNGEAMLAAYDGDGAALWQTPINAGDGNEFFGGGLDQNPAGQWVVVTRTQEGLLWIGVFDGDGNPVWDEVVDGPTNIAPYGVAATPQGRYVVVGSAYSDGENRLWYGVVDDAGTLEWSDTVGPGPGNFARANEVAVDSHGLAILGGEFTTNPMVPQELRGFVRMFAP